MARSKLDITRRENGRDVLDAKRLSRAVINNTIGKLSCDTTEGVLLVIASLAALIAMPSLAFGLLGFDSLIATMSDGTNAACMQVSDSLNCKMYAGIFSLLKTSVLVASAVAGLLTLAALLSLGHRKLVKDDVQDRSGYRRTRNFMEGCVTHLVVFVLAFAALSIETDATQWLMPVSEQTSRPYYQYDPGLSTAPGTLPMGNPIEKSDLKPAPRIVQPGQPGYGKAVSLNHALWTKYDKWVINESTGTALACTTYRMRTDLYSNGQVVCTGK